jgi:predicted ATPase/class 3 adenylate cyclase
VLVRLETVTLLFTDLTSSTRRWEADAARMSRALEVHDRLLREEIEVAGGEVFKHTGDGCCARFVDAPGAVRAAIGVQRRLAAGEAGELSARIAIHTGSAEARGGDWFGPALNRCARILALVHGGQIVVSDVSTALAREQMAEMFIDLGVHTLRDLATPERLWQVVADGIPREFPPLASRARKGNLPSPRTRLVGRTTDIDELTKLLDDCRLVTLTGVGGCGKTRLAIAVASQAADEFEDGAWFVDLAPVADGAHVASAIANALDMPRVIDAPGDIAQYLASKASLVIMDNCEHVLDDVAELLDDLLAGAPQLRVVATSREPLGTEDERVWRVASLSSSGEQSEALQLFDDRALAVRHDFRIDDHRGAVGEICRRLDGIPLAIEFAAAQMGVLTPEVVATMLDERFTLLTGGRRRGRQATLAALMDWSYELLTSEEQAGLRRATVFPASFSLSGFAAVIERADTEAIALLRSLVAKSLVDLHDADGEARYRLLETVRLYGEARLVEAGEAPVARDALFTWVRQTLEATDPGYELATATLRERDAINAALSWAEANDRVAELATLASLAGGGWIQYLLVDDCARWSAVIEPFDDELSLPHRVMWRAMRAGVAMMSADGLTGLEWADRALECNPGGETFWHGWARFTRTQVLAFVDPARSRAEITREATRTPQPLISSLFAVWDGMLDLMNGEDERAAHKLGHVIATWDHGRERWAVTLARLAHSTALDFLGEHAQAIAEAVAVVDELPAHPPWFEDLMAYQALADATARAGDTDRAASYLERMLRIAADRYSHISSAIGHAVVTAGVILAERGETGTAIETLEGARATLLAARSEMGWTTALRYVRQLRAQLGPDARPHLDRGRSTTPAALLATAQRVAVSTQGSA